MDFMGLVVGAVTWIGIEFNGDFEVYFLRHKEVLVVTYR